MNGRPSTVGSRQISGVKISFIPEMRPLRFMREKIVYEWVRSSWGLALLPHNNYAFFFCLKV